MTTIAKARASVAVAVLTVSDSRTPERDTSGETIMDRLTQAGHRIADRKMCTDDRVPASQDQTETSAACG